MKRSNNIAQGGRNKKTEFAERIIGLLFSGEQLSEEERDAICRYLSDEKNASDNEEALFLYFSSKSNPEQPIGKSIFADEMWPEIAQALGMNPDLDHYRAIRAARAKRGRTFGGPSWRRVAVRVAAVVVPVMLVVGGYLGWRAMTSDGRGDGWATATFAASHTVAAQPDSIRTITLADGTEVTLNRNSTLSYNENREAELSGEAYFKVAEDPEQPFVIHSGHLRVTVFGTEFNFQTQTEEGSSKLSLYEGRVQLAHPGGTDNLEEGGREFTLDLATGGIDIRDFDNTQKPQWLTEAQEPLLEIISLDHIFDLIEVGYGVTILNREAVDTTRKFNFMLDDATSIDEVMQALQFASGEFGYTINDKTITLERK